MYIYIYVFPILHPGDGKDSMDEFQCCVSRHFLETRRSWFQEETWSWQTCLRRWIFLIPVQVQHVWFFLWDLLFKLHLVETAEAKIWWQTSGIADEWCHGMLEYASGADYFSLIVNLQGCVSMQSHHTSHTNSVIIHMKYMYISTYTRSIVDGSAYHLLTC